MATMMVFLDSNVFLYAAGQAHPLREPCRAALQQVSRGDLEATTSAEVVQELLHVTLRRGLRKEGVELARKVLDAFPGLLPVTAQVMLAACELAARYPELSTRDAVHAATMQSNNLRVIISADKHFDAIAGLERIDPGALRAGSLPGSR